MALHARACSIAASHATPDERAAGCSATHIVQRHVVGILVWCHRLGKERTPFIDIAIEGKCGGKDAIRRVSKKTWILTSRFVYFLRSSADDVEHGLGSGGDVFFYRVLSSMFWPAIETLLGRLPNKKQETRRKAQLVGLPYASDEISPDCRASFTAFSYFTVRHAVIRTSLRLKMTEPECRPRR